MGGALADTVIKYGMGQDSIIMTSAGRSFGGGGGGWNGAGPQKGFY